MFAIALNEMLTHIPICSHKKPKDILLISDNALSIADEIQKYIGLNFSITNSFELVPNSYDVILIYQKELNEENLEIIHQALREDGILSVANFSYLTNDFKKNLSLINSKFKIVMPYRVESETPMNYFIFASKLYHPSADMIMQRAELLEDVKYYNYNLHLACFDLPKLVFDDIKNISKR